MSQNNSPQELTKKVALGAERYLSDYDEEILLDLAVRNWSEVDDSTSQLRPAPQTTRKFLKDVIKESVKEITTKYKDLSAVTLTCVTQELISYLITIGFVGLQPYTIPLGILSAIIYRKTLEEIEKRL